MRSSDRQEARGTDPAALETAGGETGPDNGNLYADSGMRSTVIMASGKVAETWLRLPEPFRTQPSVITKKTMITVNNTSRSAQAIP
jgi:hypothetical protein